MKIPLAERQTERECKINLEENVFLFFFFYSPMFLFFASRSICVRECVAYVLSFVFALLYYFAVTFFFFFVQLFSFSLQAEKMKEGKKKKRKKLHTRTPNAPKIRHEMKTKFATRIYTRAAVVSFFVRVLLLLCPSSCTFVSFSATK